MQHILLDREEAVSQYVVSGFVVVVMVSVLVKVEAISMAVRQGRSLHLKTEISTASEGNLSHLPSILHHCSCVILLVADFVIVSAPCSLPSCVVQNRGLP